jgi:hypothetical protein
MEFPAITESNEAGISILSAEVIAPDVFRDIRIGEISVKIDGDVKVQYLPLLRILSPEGFFEEDVVERLRTLGYEAVRLGGPSQPDVEATHRKRPEEKFQVETTSRNRYDIQEYRTDIAKHLSLKREKRYHHLLIVVNASRISEAVKEKLQREREMVSLVLFRDLAAMASLYQDAEISSYEVIALLSQRGLVQPSFARKKREAASLTGAPSLRTVRVSVRFEPSAINLTDEANIIAQIKETEVTRVLWIDEIRTVVDFANLVKLVQSLGHQANNASVIETFFQLFRKAFGQNVSDDQVRVHCRDAVRVLRTLGIIDEDDSLSIQGDKMFRYSMGDPQRLSDLATRLLLVKGGWIAVITSIDDMKQGALWPRSRNLLAEMIFDDLVRRGLAKKTDKWSPLALVDCLVDMGILDEWDSVQKTHAIDWDRIYDVLIRKSMI